MINVISIKSQVDSALLDQVEQECYQILFQQRLHYNDRIYSSKLFLVPLSFLRLAGLVTSIIGVIISVFYLVYPGSCPTWFYTQLFLLFFIGGVVLFYFLPRLHARHIARMKKTGEKSCKRLARRYVSRGRKIIPYEIEYTIRGDLITAFRGKEDSWKQAWSTRLKGFAIMGKTVTLLFRNPNSIVQKMLIIHENSDALESVLKDLDIPCRKLDPTVA
jgi:hypothetical protein